MASVLTSVSRVKSQLRIPSTVTTWDTALTDIVDGVDAQVAALLALTGLASATYTDRYTIGRAGVDRVPLRNRPVISVTSATEDGTLLVQGTDYALDGNQLLRLDGGYFVVGAQKLVVVYVAGFATYPEPLKRLATLYVAREFTQSPALGTASERLGDRTVALAGTDEPAIQHLEAIYRQMMPRSLQIG